MMHGQLVVMCYTVYTEHLADIKFGDLGANTGWRTFSLANQLRLVGYTTDYK